MHCRFIGQAFKGKKSYDQTERRFDRKASFSVKLQETESVNNFVKTETNVKNKGLYSVL